MQKPRSLLCYDCNRQTKNKLEDENKTNKLSHELFSKTDKSLGKCRQMEMIVNKSKTNVEECRQV